MTHPAFDPDRLPGDRSSEDPPDRALDNALQALTPFRPSRDLWPEIDARLDAPRQALTPPPPPVRALPPRRRWLAAAAVALMAVSSGATYLVVRGPVTPTTEPSAAVPPALPRTPTAPTAPQATAEGAVEPSAGALSAIGSDAVNATASDTPAHSVHRRPDDLLHAVAVRAGGAVDTAVPGAAEYDREIAELRGVVADRHSELDSATVAVLARNLQIIDAAIAASRAALARDPHSPFLGEQLTRALGQKVDLLRTAALLPRT